MICANDQPGGTATIFARLGRGAQRSEGIDHGAWTYCAVAAHMNLGVALGEKGDLDHAIAAYRK